MSRIQLLTRLLRLNPRPLSWKPTLWSIERLNRNYCSSDTLMSSTEKKKKDAETNNLEETIASFDEKRQKLAANISMKRQHGKKRKYVMNNIFKMMGKPEHIEKLSAQEMELLNASEMTEARESDLGGEVKKEENVMNEGTSEILTEEEAMNQITAEISQEEDSVGKVILEAPVEETPILEAPVEKTPILEGPVEKTPILEGPVEKTPPEQEMPEKEMKKMIKRELANTSNNISGEKAEVNLTEKDSKLPVCRPISEILDSVRGDENIKECVEAMGEITRTLRKTKVITPEMIKEMDSSPKFAYLLTTLTEGQYSVNTFNLSKIFVVIAYLPNVDVKVKKMIADAVERNVFNFQISHLLRVYSAIESLEQEGKSSWIPLKLKGSVKQELQNSWLEISKADHLVKALRIFPRPDPKFCQKIMSRILMYIDEMSVHQLIEVLKFLERNNARDMKILKACAYHLAQQNDSIKDVLQINDILFCLSRLNFTQQDFLGGLCEKLLLNQTVIDHSNSSLDWQRFVDSICHSLASLNYREERFFNIVLEKLMTDSKNMTEKYAISLLFALARLGYRPPTSYDNVLHEMVDMVICNLDLSTHLPMAMLRFVWSTCVLNLANEELVSAALDKKFVQNLIKGPQNNKPRYIMLQDIDGYAKHCIQGYSGNRLTEEMKKRMPQESPSETDFNPFKETLNKLVPHDSHSVRDVKFSEGYLVDAVMCLDSAGTIQPLVMESRGGFHRVAVKYLSFYHCTMPEGKPNGRTVLMTEQLHKQGYKTIFVPYSAWLKELTFVKRVALLQKEFKKCVT